MGNTDSRDSWQSNFRELKNIHDKAYSTIQDAITLEEHERPNDAVEKYKQGILTLDKALDVVITCPENPDQTWEQACGMVQKMKKTRAEVMMRVTSITSAPSYVHNDPPPSYEDAVQDDPGCSSPRTYGELAEALSNLHIETPEGLAEVVYSQDAVQLYFISPSGVVLSASQQEILYVAIIRDRPKEKGPTAFLKIGDWIYPLVPGVSPCYKTNYGAFILPDVHSNTPGSSVGIILPGDAQEYFLELLENILHGVVNQEDKLHVPPKAEPQKAEDISKMISRGAYYISKGLIFGAQKTGELLNYGTPKLINNLTPAQQPTTVAPSVTKSLKVAENVTSKAAEVTGVLASNLGTATSRLGQFLAPHIQRQGTRLLTSRFNMSEEDAANKVSGILTVAAGAVEGFATVYQGLETSASILGKNLKENSVKIVEHKYGGNAGQVTNETLNTVGNVINIRQNAKIFTPKGLAKSTAIGTGLALTQDLNGPTTSTATVQVDDRTRFQYPFSSIPDKISPSNNELYPDFEEETKEEPSKWLKKKE